jgi:hypothetical protein
MCSCVVKGGLTVSFERETPSLIRRRPSAKHREQVESEDEVGDDEASLILQQRAARRALAVAGANPVSYLALHILITHMQ